MIAGLIVVYVLQEYMTKVNISVALPFISESYGWTDQQSGANGGLLLGSFLVGYGVSNILVSPFVDRVGARRGILIIMAAWSLITFFTGFVGLFFGLFVFMRVILGLTEGPTFPAASKLTQAWFDVKGRTRMNAFTFSTLYLSNLIVPAVIVPLIIVTSWPWAFYSIGILGLVLLVPIYLFVQDTPVGNAPRTRAPMRQTLAEQWRSIRDSLRVKGIMVLSIADIATNLAWWGVSLWLPTYLVQAKGISHGELAFAASVPYVGGVIGVYIGSWISRRTGRIVLTAAVFSVLCAVFILLIIGTTGILDIVAVMFLIFFFISILQPNLFTLLQGVCPPRLIGSATGWMNGIAVGVGALGPVIIGTSVSVTGSFGTGLVILAGLQVFAGLVLLLFRERPAGTPSAQTGVQGSTSS